MHVRSVGRSVVDDVEALATWVVPVVLGVFGGVQTLVLLLFHLWQKSDELRRTEIVKGLHESIAKIEQWQKDKEKFDFEFRHNEYASAITDINKCLWPMVTRVEVNEKSIENLRHWKHTVVDPYVPRAVDEHERRLNRLDIKVFNGDR